jgi:putative MATE family efflux protein
LKHSHIFKEFSKYVTVNILGMIGLSCYILADTYFIAQGLGSHGLAALNLAISVYSFIHGTGLMIGVGGATKFSILKAQGRHEEANRYFTHSVGFGLFIGLLFLLTGVFLSGPIARLLGADGDTFAMTSVYLRTILCFAPFFIANNVLLAFVRNDHAPKLAMGAMLLGSFSNIGLDYLFLFPCHMGMFGAALATGIAPVLGILTLSTHFFQKDNQLRLSRCAFKLKKCGTILSLGLSAFISEISSGIVLIVFNLIILSLAGTVGVAAYGIIANLALVILSIFTGIAQGIQPMVSRFYGMDCRQKLIPLLKYGLILSLGIAAFTYGIAWGLGDLLVAAFNSEGDTQLAAMAKEGMLLYFTGFFFAGVNVVSAAFLSAAEQPAKGLLISLGRGCLFLLPIVFLLSSFLGMKGVWLSFPAAEGMSTALSILFLICAQKKWSGRSS